MGNYIARGGYDDIPDKNNGTIITYDEEEDKYQPEVVEKGVKPRFISEGYGTDSIDEATYQREKMKRKESLEKKTEEQERMRLEGMIKNTTTCTPAKPKNNTPKKSALVITYEEDTPIILPKKKPLSLTATPSLDKKGKVVSYKGVDNVYILSGDTFSVKDLIKDIPGRKWEKDQNVWTVPLNEKSKQMLDIIIEKQKASK